MEDILVKNRVFFDGIPQEILQEFSIVELNFVESLLTPGLQTSILVHNARHHIPTDKNGKPASNRKIPKTLEPLKNKVTTILLEKENLKQFKDHNGNTFNDKFEIVQRAYRISNRKMISYNVEELTIFLCDDTLLNDARNLVSKSWKCATPSSIAKEVLSNCVKAKSLEVESAGPARDFIAENIHPFQVVTQQCEVALASGDDPSFVHFMTYENFDRGDPRGKHHFRSLHKMAQAKPIYTFEDSETGARSMRHDKPYVILTHEHPADFDYLYDILNGVGEKGNSLITTNPFTKSVSLLGNKTVGCGMGGQNMKESFTNFGSPNATGCNSNVEKYLLKRQARMALLANENIGLRLTVPFNMNFHVGQTIRARLRNKNDPTKRNYGNGVYLIAAIHHNVKSDGIATTTMDCVSNTVSEGEL